MTITRQVAATVLAVSLLGATPGLGPADAQAAESSMMRPGALDDVPRHLVEIGWETDLPALLVIRFMPERMAFDAGWSSWALEVLLRQRGFLNRSAVDPWPPFFQSDRTALNRNGGQLAPPDMRAFQAWCLRRSQVLPRVIVHAIPFVAPAAGDAPEVRLLPLGTTPGQPRDGQRITGIGFAQTVYLGLTRNADDDAVVVPRDVLASLPPVGVTLETRLRWSDPIRVDGTLLVPGVPQSLRLAADRRVLWEHVYPAAVAGSAASSQARSPAAGVPLAPGPQSDIKF